MNILRSMFFASLILLALLPQANAANAQGCSNPASGRASWVQLLSRALKLHDSTHAARMTEVASEIINGQVGKLKADISAGLNPNTSLKLSKFSNLGMSLLDLAVAACQSRIVHLLVESGASVNGTGAGSPPLNIAAAKGETWVTEFLIQHGAAINRIGVNGLTALDGAVRQRQLDTVKVLLAHGANPNHAVGGGARILDIVSHSSKPVDQAIAKELRKYGAVGTLPPAPK